MLILALLWLLRLPFDPRLKRVLIGVVLVIGLAGFFWRYLGFFEKGATSVGARFDYWQAAARTTLAHPVFGTGPGTFAIPYAKIKRPEWEMSRLVHNDYLEQASDSGLPGFILYTAFILGALVLSVRELALGKAEPTANSGPVETRSKSNARGTANPVDLSGSAEVAIAFALWLGVLGWALQSVLEFSLYIPALAWIAFAFLGLLLRRLVDKPPRN